MKKRILLITQWIFDFSAFNLRARLLGLLTVAEFLSSFECSLSMTDNTDSFSQYDIFISIFRL